MKAQQTQGNPDERADQLIQELTLDEKMQLVSGAPDGFSTHAIERLGIPSFAMSDGPQGVRNGPGNPPPRACAFPCAAALAATWDVDLAAAYGKAMGLEARARGTAFQLGPALNIWRVPVNGRNFEYFGEDPFLTAMIAAPWVKACSAEGVVPTIKHFAANNQESNRNTVDALVDERTLHEIYLPAFKKAATAGGTVAVMCSYNRLNGEFTSNSNWLLNETLKQAWGFQGLVMSDWGASHAVSDLAHGLDLEMPNGRNLSSANLKTALANNTMDIAQLNGAVHRLLRTAFAMGWLDAGWVQKNEALPLDSDDSAKTALEVAQASIVLLKNEHEALPLDRTKIKHLVVVGPNATVTSGTLPINIGGGGSGAVTPFASRFAEADYLQGIIKAAGAGVQMTYLPMPGEPAREAFMTMPGAQTSAKGEPGLKLDVHVTGPGDFVHVASVVQPGIDLTWSAGQLPYGVPAGRDATYTWSGVLLPPHDGDWQIHLAGALGNEPGLGFTILIDGDPAGEGWIIHLRKNKPTPIKIELRVKANPISGRGRRGAGARGAAGAGRANNYFARLTLTPPAIPDLAAVKNADAAIVCVGLNRNLEAEGRDRGFDISSVQQYLIEHVAAANKRTIVINNSGSAVNMLPWINHTAAVLQAWYLGQEGGVAIGHVLFGDVNPSGRLCGTFDRNFKENPAFSHYPGQTPPGMDHPFVRYEEGLFYGYRGYDKLHRDPLFPFGFGLSYTSFAMSNLKTEQVETGVKVSLDVKNIGERVGEEVVQIYVGEQGCPMPRPLRELKGFTKISLEAGETKRIKILLPKDAFAYWSPEKKDWTVDPGNMFTIEAAASERDIKLKQTIRLE